MNVSAETGNPLSDLKHAPKAVLVGLLVLIAAIIVFLSMPDKKDSNQSISMTEINSVTNQLFTATAYLEQGLWTEAVEELNKIFINNPELWPYFELGEDISPNDKNYFKVVALATFHLDLIDSIWTESNYIERLQRDSSDEWKSWDSWINELFEKSPIMCKRLKKVSSWYVPEFITYLEEKCSG